LWLIGFLVRLQARYNIPDSAIGCLVLFLYTFFQTLGHFSTFIVGLADQFPSSLHRLRKMLKIDYQFAKYIVCPKCEQLYHRDSCVRRIGSKEENLTCSYSEFSNHPHHAWRQCSQQLLKKVHLQSGKVILYPFKVYCYHSIQSYLEHSLLHLKFMENCDHWKHTNSTGMLQDVYNGRIWHQFTEVLPRQYITIRIRNSEHHAHQEIHNWRQHSLACVKVARWQEQWVLWTAANNYRQNFLGLCKLRTGDRISEYQSHQEMVSAGIAFPWPV